MSFSIYAGTNLFIWLAVLSGEIAEVSRAFMPQKHPN